MRKLCLILSFILALSAVPFLGTVSAREASAEITANSACTLLYDLNIIDDGYLLNNAVTRGEFCGLIARTLGINSFSSTSASYTDVAASHPYYNDIMSVFEWGIISDSTHFRPDDAITPAEAVKMAVSALGCDFIAQSRGGWPNGYLGAAASLGLDAPAQMNGSGAANLIYQMLKCKLPNVAIINSELQYYPGQGDTLLQKVWGLEFMTGEVTDGQYFGLTKPNGAGEGKAIIGGYSFSRGQFDTDSLLGETVDVYYNSKGSICSIFAMGEEAEKSITVYSNQELAFADGVYSFYDRKSEEEESISMLSTSLVVYNGKKASFDPDGMVPQNGYIKFIKDSSGAARVIIIKDYLQMVAGGIVPEEFLVSNQLASGESFDFGDEYIVFKNQNGKTAYFTDIAADDVLWIAQSIDKTLTEVIICKDIIIGEYSGKSDSQGTVFIDGSEYRANAYAKNQLDTLFSMGEIVTGHINPYGEIVFVSANADADAKKIGFLIETSLAVNGLDKAIYAKILCSDGTIEVMTLAPKFSVNSALYNKDAATNYSLLPKQEQMPQSMQRGIISYTVNDEGLLTSLNYSDDNMTGLTGTAPGLYEAGIIDGYSDNYIEYKRTGRWITGKTPGRIFVSASSIMFVVPKDEDCALADDDDYRTETMSSWGVTRNIGKRHLTGYALAAGDDTSEYIVSRVALGTASRTVSTTATMYMVESLKVVLDSDNTPKAAITVRNASGTASEYYSEDIDFFENIGLEMGDIIKLSADSGRNVKGLLFVYRPGESSFRNTSIYGSSGYTEKKDKTVLTNNAGMESIAESYVVVGNVYEKGSSGMNLLPLNTLPANYNGEDLHGYTLQDVNLSVYDKDAKTIVSGKASAIKSYLDFGDECSVVVAETRSGHISSMFVCN